VVDSLSLARISGLEVVAVRNEPSASTLHSRSAKASLLDIGMPNIVTARSEKGEERDAFRDS
jgi:hypothetical protein